MITKPSKHSLLRSIYFVLSFQSHNITMIYKTWNDKQKRYCYETRYIKDEIIMQEYEIYEIQNTEQ